MTVAGTYAPGQDSGNGVTTSFGVAFPFFAKADIGVYLYDTVAEALVDPQPVLNGGGTYDYSVTGAASADTGEYPSGTVVFNSAPLGNHIVTRVRVTAALQGNQFRNNAPFPAKTVEASLDRPTMTLQEIGQALLRAVSAPAYEGALGALPVEAVRAGNIFEFDDDGNPVAVNNINSIVLAAAAALSQAAAQALAGSPIAVTAADHVATALDYIVEMDASGGPRLFTMPLVLGSATLSKWIRVVKTDQSRNAVTISDGTNVVDVINAPASAAGQINGWRDIYSNGAALRCMGIG